MKDIAMRHSALKEWFAAHEAEGIELLAALIREDTTNPPGNEYRAARVVEEYCRRYGIPTETHEMEAGRTNLFARVGSGRPVVFVPAHLDVVPAGDGWETDPFEPVVREGTMYGRGTTDDKGPLTSVLLLAAFFSTHPDMLPGTFLVGAVADEERGSSKGMEYLAENGMIDADMAIVPDTGESISRVICGEKGLLHCDVTFQGIQAHGSQPEKGVNAVWAAHAFLSKIRELFGEAPGYLEDEPHELFSPATISVGTISGGKAHNIVPASCTVGLDIRTRPEKGNDEMIALIRALADDVKRAGECTGFEIETHADMPAFMIDGEHALVRAVSTAVRTVADTEPERFGMSGTTVSKQLVAQGIPAIGFSQNAGGRMHMANEHIELEEIPAYGVALGLVVTELEGDMHVPRTPPISGP